jgi:hypothetical protein
VISDQLGSSCVATLSNISASIAQGSCNLSTTNPGVATLVANYSGSADFMASSAIESHTVSPGSEHAPSIRSFECPSVTDARPGRGSYVCRANYKATGPVAITWSGEGFTDDNTSRGFSQFYGRCQIGQIIQVRFTVTNAFGTASEESKPFTCQ